MATHFPDCDYACIFFFLYTTTQVAVVSSFFFVCIDDVLFNKGLNLKKYKFLLLNPLSLFQDASLPLGMFCQISKRILSPSLYLFLILSLRQSWLALCRSSKE